MLTLATGEQYWRPFLAESGWAWNDEAGEVAGVVALKYAGSTGPELEAETTNMAQEVVRRLRSELPAAILEASWADASSYALSAPLAQRQRDEGRSIVSLPASTENPLARPCEKCHQSPACRATSDGNRCCVDCAMRYAAAGNSYQAAGALRPIVDELTSAGDESAAERLPKHMRALAEVGRDSSRNAATRVAVIYADGNNLGVVLKKLAETVGLRSIARGVDEATKRAFVSAARSHCVTEPNGRGQRDIGIIPHIVGGDDVVASVTARFAWDFVVTLARQFADEMGNQPWIEGADVATPDLSVGLVFQHKSEPLTHTFDRAAARLAEAKKLERAALTWLDLQIDGPDEFHPARPLTWVEEHLDTGRELAGRPAHLRQTLRSALEWRRDGWRAVGETVRKQDVSELKPIVQGPYTPGRATDLLWLLQIARDVAPATRRNEASA